MIAASAYPRARRRWPRLALALALAALALPAPAAATFPQVGQLVGLPGGTECVESPYGPTGLPCSIKTRAIFDVQSVAISPDGRFAYAASVTSDSLGVFARNAVTGALTPIPAPNDCIEGLNAPASTTCDTTARGLDGPVTVALSPDGDYV